MRLAITVMTGILLATAGSSLHAQSAPAAPPKAAAKPAAQAATPAQKPTTQPPPPAAKPAAKPVTPPAAPPAAAQKPTPKPAAQAAVPKAPAKPATAPNAAKTAAKPAKKPAAKKAASSTPSATAEPSEAKVSRRDPFESLTSRQEAAARAGANLPPGKAGLQVGTLRLDGIVRAPNGMITVFPYPPPFRYGRRDGTWVRCASVKSCPAPA